MMCNTRRIFTIAVLLSSFVRLALATPADIRGYLPASWGDNDDLKSYIQNALDTEGTNGVYFTGSGDINNPLVYPSTCTLNVPDGATVWIDRSAVIKRLPSKGRFIILGDNVTMTCPNWGLSYGRIDGNKYEHDIYVDDPDLNYQWSTIMTGSNCNLSKIYVYDSVGFAFFTYSNNCTVQYCKAENVGMLDLKFGQNYYAGGKDRWSGDGFYFAGYDHLIKNCIAIDCQRWDFCSSHELTGRNTYQDCQGQDVNFRTYGLTDIEAAETGSTLIRVNNTSPSGSIGEDSNKITVCTPDTHLVDCNVGISFYNFYADMTGNTINGGQASALTIGRYPATIGTLEVFGTLTLTDSLTVLGGNGFTLHQSSGTVDIANNFIDERGAWSPDADVIFNVVQQGTLSIGRQFILANEDVADIDYEIDGGNLFMNSQSTDRLLVVGAQGSASLLVKRDDGSPAISEGTSYDVPMAVRWLPASDAALQGYGKIALTGWFVNNGKVIADGQGTERSLDMTTFASVNSHYSVNGSGDDGAPVNIENTADNGWYAVNQGKLMLPVVEVASSTTAVNWGESPDDTVIDLVNSMRFRLNTAPSATRSLNVSLLAVDCPQALYGAFIGLWDIDYSLDAGNSAVLEFRYDDAGAAQLGIDQQQLRVYARAHGETQWQDVTGAVSVSGKRITTVALNALSGYYVAVGIMPQVCGDPGTAYLTSDRTGPADISDCRVDMLDFALLSANWLNGYDWNDLSILASQWLACTDPADSLCDEYWK